MMLLGFEAGLDFLVDVGRRWVGFGSREGRCFLFGRVWEGGFELFFFFFLFCTSRLGSLAGRFFFSWGGNLNWGESEIWWWRVLRDEGGYP